ncbi:hypothetical protein PI125_g24226 [Phytophthora idaei]|nr:hypothetical protein PI125_g24226 [Phytophthora idaei]KAG3126483.1 hypothetical protein PI126_g22303 [Phytophthora idaei]
MIVLAKYCGHATLRRGRRATSSQDGFAGNSQEGSPAARRLTLVGTQEWKADIHRAVQAISAIGTTAETTRTAGISAHPELSLASTLYPGRARSSHDFLAGGHPGGGGGRKQQPATRTCNDMAFRQLSNGDTQHSASHGLSE